jgi:hypothetical protein
MDKINKVLIKEILEKKDLSTLEDLEGYKDLLEEENNNRDLLEKINSRINKIKEIKKEKIIIEDQKIIMGISLLVLLLFPLMYSILLFGIFNLILIWGISFGITAISFIFAHRFETYLLKKKGIFEWKD